MGDAVPGSWRKIVTRLTHATAGAAVEQESCHEPESSESAQPHAARPRRERARAAWGLAGLVDGERFLFGDPLLDFVSPALFRRIEEEPEHPFVLGYAAASGRPAAFTAGERRRLELYRLHLYLLMTVEMPSRGMTRENETWLTAASTWDAAGAGEYRGLYEVAGGLGCACGDPETLRARLSVDGYLFFRGLLPRAEVEAAGAAVRAALAAGGWADAEGRPVGARRALNAREAVSDPAYRKAAGSAEFNRIPYLKPLRTVVRGLLGAGGVLLSGEGAARGLPGGRRAAARALRPPGLHRRGGQRHVHHLGAADADPGARSADWRCCRAATSAGRRRCACCARSRPSARAGRRRTTRSATCCSSTA
jgi:hypothetical protein